MAQNNKPDDDISDKNSQMMDYTCWYTINYFNISYKFLVLLFHRQLVLL